MGDTQKPKPNTAVNLRGASLAGDGDGDSDDADGDDHDEEAPVAFASNVGSGTSILTRTVAPQRTSSESSCSRQEREQQETKKEEEEQDCQESCSQAVFSTSSFVVRPIPTRCVSRGKICEV